MSVNLTRELESQLEQEVRLGTNGLLQVFVELRAYPKYRRLNLMAALFLWPGASLSAGPIPKADLSPVSVRRYATEPPAL